MREELKFIRATPEHIELLLPLMQEFYVYDHHKYVEKKAMAALNDFLSSDQWGYAWLIYFNEKLIGYVVITFGFSLEFGGRDAFIDEVYLREPYRGMGVGTHIIDYLKEVCQAEDIRALHLEVGKENNDAYRFYLKVGFEDRQSKMMSLYL
jgi:GNAT superfamily N-acetyltransferase